jgi:hypothetical protein
MEGPASLKGLPFRWQLCDCQKVYIGPLLGHIGPREYVFMALYVFRCLPPCMSSFRN